VLHWPAFVAKKRLWSSGEAALKIDPTSVTALDGLAKPLISLGDDESVISRLRSAQLDENLTLDLVPPEPLIPERGMLRFAVLRLGFDEEKVRMFQMIEGMFGQTC
jgi:hypothetical protein